LPDGDDAADRRLNGTLQGNAADQMLDAGRKMLKKENDAGE
jgi:hypothetical protein